MRYFPAFFDFSRRPVFVVGGGEIAVRKTRLLVQGAEHIHVFLGQKQSHDWDVFDGQITVYNRLPTDEDYALKPSLVIAAADDPAVDLPVAERARRHGAVVNMVDAPDECDVVIPSIVARGDMAIGISTGGAAPVLGRRLRERLEALLPARLGDLIAFAKTRRDRVADAVPPAQRRGFWERLFSGPAAEAVLDGDMAAAEHAFSRTLDKGRDANGVVHIVGAGPGDPELLTLKALRVLQEADIVLYDNLVSDGVLDLIRRDAERRYVGKRTNDHSMPQEEIGKLMINLAQSGKRVVRLKGGDPFIFGRGGEERDALMAAGISAHVIPGITAAQGCAAAAGIPLTHRSISQAVTYVTAQAGNGEAPDVDWQALASLGHTIVVYMGLRKAGTVAQHLMGGGLALDTPAAIIARGTCPDQKILRTSLKGLGETATNAGPGPALLIIGEVAARADADLVVLKEEALAA